MNYVKGGNCIPKNQLEDMMNVSDGIYKTCTDSGTPNNRCDEYKTGDCPWWRTGSPYTGYTYNTMTDSIDGANTTFDPFCNPWYMISHCMDLEAGLEVGAGFTCTNCNVTATVAKIKADIHTDSCRSSKHLAAYKMHLATITTTPVVTTPRPDTTVATSATSSAPSSGTATTSSPATATTVPPTADVDSLAVLVAICLPLAVLS
jgi:hypothetical protein